MLYFSSFLDKHSKSEQGMEDEGEEGRGMQDSHKNENDPLKHFFFFLTDTDRGKQNKNVQTQSHEQNGVTIS